MGLMGGGFAALSCRLLLEGADVADAVLAARVHDQLLPADDTYYENYTWSVACRLGNKPFLHSSSYQQFCLDRSWAVAQL